MKTANLTHCLALSALTASLLGAMVQPQSALAQVTAPNEAPYTANEVDPSKQGLGNGFDPMSLIHNANLSRSRNGSDFAEDTRRNLNQAADQFKQLQQQRMLEMQQQSEPVMAPEPGTPQS